MSRRVAVRGGARLALGLAAGSLLATGCAEIADPSDEDTLDTTPVAATVKEKFVYLPAINSGDDINPDMLFTVDVNPSSPSYGKILNRVDMPEVGDNVHHAGYSLDHKRLFVPGMFSDNMHIFDVSTTPAKPKLIRKRDDLVSSSGYLGPHSVIPMLGNRVLVTMLGAATEDGGPAGLIWLSDRDGSFLGHFGPGPDRSNGEVGADYAYDAVLNASANRLLTTTWGWPSLVFGEPFLGGDTVAMWDTTTETVIQKTVIPADPEVGYDTSAPTEADWLTDGSNRGLMITDDGQVILWDDNGTAAEPYTFTPVVQGLLAPCDMTISKDNRWMYIGLWFGGEDYGGSVAMYDIRNPAAPRLAAEIPVPHPCMIQLSPDNKRLYVTNSVTRVHDDYDFGRISNDQYGLWVLNISTNGRGGLSHSRPGGAPLTRFDNVQKKHNRGPAGPHMILFDPDAAPKGPGSH
jgi:methanethiol oxidase